MRTKNGLFTVEGHSLLLKVYENNFKEELMVNRQSKNKFDFNVVDSVSHEGKQMGLNLTQDELQEVVFEDWLEHYSAEEKSQVVFEFAKWLTQ